MTSGLHRRQFLWLGLSTLPVLGLTAGCSVDDPRIETPQGTAEPTPVSNGTKPAPTPVPTPGPTFAGAREGADSEQRLAGLAGVVASERWRSGLGNRRPLILGIRDAHLAHAAALLGPRPTARPTDPTTKPIGPPTAPKSLETALKRLARAELDAAARLQSAALSTTGYSALLWGSMSVAAASYASAMTSARPVPVRKPAPSRPMPQLSDVEAMQTFIRQLHAIIYGYQLAIGQLADGSRRNTAVRRLAEHRVLLDWSTTTLLARSAPVPAAEPAYVPSVYPRSDETAAQLIQSMETALAPFCGLWLAAANAPERGRAFAALSATVATARRYGAPVSVWPGWSS